MRAAFQRLLADEARTEVLGLIKEAQSLLTQRNKFAHSIYGDNDRGLAIVGLGRDKASDLPLHDLKHQLERMRALSYRVGRLVSIRVGYFQEQPSEQHASDVLQSIESSSGGARIHPSPQSRPKPSGQ
jgi:hypothetical protein